MLAYLDRDGQCRFANAAYRGFGPATHEALVASLEKLLSGEHHSFEQPLVDKDGTSKRWLFSCVPDVRGGTVVGFLAHVTELHATPHRGSEPGAEPAPPNEARRALRVLFVDDDATICKIAERWLGRHGCEVTTFTDPEAALTHFSSAPDGCDVVVTDLSMPGASGVEITARMLAVRADLPVILATGNPGDLTLDGARALGFRDLMQKPVALGDLLLAITRALEGSRGVSRT